MLNSLYSSPTDLFHYIKVPVANMRASPNENSEMVSQALYSESVTILGEDQEWLKIETPFDNYQGWIKSEQLCQAQKQFPATPSEQTVKINRCSVHLYHTPDTIYGPVLTLPFESLLQVIEGDAQSNDRWIKVRTFNGLELFVQRGDVSFNRMPLSFGQLAPFSQQFLGLPYTWGGRSSFGYDCSGFVQMLYRQMGIHLPRDSKDQAKSGLFATVEKGNLAEGDLLFFGLSRDQISHVGMYLGADQFVHATVAENAPYIHISNLSSPTWNGLGHYPYKIFKTLKLK